MYQNVQPYETATEEGSKRSFEEQSMIIELMYSELENIRQLERVVEAASGHLAVVVRAQIIRRRQFIEQLW